MSVLRTCIAVYEPKLFNIERTLFCSHGQNRTALKISKSMPPLLVHEQGYPLNSPYYSRIVLVPSSPGSSIPDQMDPTPKVDMLLTYLLSILEKYYLNVDHVVFFRK